MTELAGAWIRVSTGGQDEQNQVPDIERYCRDRDYEIAIRYVLNDRSASKGEQEAKQQEALGDVAARRISVVVAWASDRVERRGSEATLAIFRKFAEAGGRLESVQEPFLSGKPEDTELMRAITGWKDRAESARKAERIGLAHDRIREAGALIGRPPFGYTTKGKKYARELVPTEAGRKYVPEIFARVIKGDSLATIAAWLNAEGVHLNSRKGSSWWPRSLGALVRNPTYMGHRVDGEGKVIHECEALVDAATFRKAGEALDKRPKRGPANTANRAMLSGVLCCPRCGDSPMYRFMSGRKPRQIAYYRCTGRGASRKGCGNMVKLAHVDEAVCRIAEQSFNRKVTVTTIIPGHDHAAELETARFAMKQAMLRNLDGELSDDAYDAELARLRAEKKRLESLPTEPDKVAEVELDHTYLDLWQQLEPSERGDWLAENHFTVYADREQVKVEQVFPSLEKLLYAVQYAPWSHQSSAEVELAAAA